MAEIIINEVIENKTEYMNKIVPVLCKNAPEGAISYKYDELGIVETYRIKYDDERYIVINDPLSKYLSKEWDMELDEVGLHIIAMKNLMEDDDNTIISPLSKLIQNFGIEIDIPNERLNMIVLTNKGTTYGANRILIKGILIRVYYYCFSCKPYYILPSSIHEVICVPVSDVIPVDELKKIVQDVNFEQVDERERLSDDVFIFDGKELKKLT